MTESSVSISTTSAIVYSLSGLVFFLLAVILVMMGVTNCNWDCCERYWQGAGIYNPDTLFF